MIRITEPANYVSDCWAVPGGPLMLRQIASMKRVQYEYESRITELQVLVPLRFMYWLYKLDLHHRPSRRNKFGS